MTPDDGTGQPDTNAASILRRLHQVRERIDAVERSWTHPVEILAVTKGFGPEIVRHAVDAGAAAIGENYAQELLSKADTIDSLGDRRPRVEFIGRLQTNKVRHLAGVVDVWASVDRQRLIEEIASRSPGSAIVIQVNTTGEEHKGGCAPADVGALVDAARSAGLDVRGLLTVGPTDRPADAARPGFGLLRRSVDEHGLTTCSMGMSADLDVAVAEGSTQVRIGTALFGPRG